MAHQEIEHTQIPARGINLHVAQVGKGELGTVVFLHGFPEIWYSWRHQMLTVAAAGYRAIAPDCRGYGLSDQPPENEEDSWVWDDLVADVLSILDALSIPKAFLVGKDFGAMPAYEFALQHPDRTCGVVCLGIPFSPVPFSFDTMPEGFYVLRWGEPGRAEADFRRYDVRRVVRTVYVLFSGAEIPIAKEGQEIMDLADLSTPLPEWFTEEDLDVYAKLYEKSGFRYPLQMPYRSIHKIPNRLDAKFQAPVLMVMGEKDYCFKLPEFETALRSGVMDNFMPDLKITYIPEGSHFVQEQLPEQVNELLLDFLKAKGPTPLHRELGTVVFLHGFPEIWYSWRHQMLAVAAAGYRAVAPDCRGYGLSDQPQENEEDSWVWDDLVADVLSILDALSIPKLQFKSSILDSYTYPESIETNRMLCIQCESSSLNGLLGPALVHC